MKINICKLIIAPTENRLLIHLTDQNIVGQVAIFISIASTQFSAPLGCENKMRKNK